MQDFELQTKNFSHSSAPHMQVACLASSEYHVKVLNQPANSEYLLYCGGDIVGGIRPTYFGSLY